MEKEYRISGIVSAYDLKKELNRKSIHLVREKTDSDWGEMIASRVYNINSNSKLIIITRSFYTTEKNFLLSSINISGNKRTIRNIEIILNEIFAGLREAALIPRAA